MTEILQPDSEGIAKAARIIKRGGTVAFPTETVYGLGSDALNEDAVKKVFEVKRREMSKPLIVGVASIDDVYEIAEVNEVAKKLMNAFFPGPLTLVLKKKDIVPNVVTAGLDKVAVRMPDHEVPLKLMEKAKTPIVVPSANVSGKPSPTKLEHVLEDLGGKIDAIISGECRIGIESTIVDVTTKPAKLLRPGAVSISELRRYIDVEFIDRDSYGQYEISKPLYVFVGEDARKKIIEFVADAEKKGLRAAIIARKKVHGRRIIEVGESIDEYAKKIFEALRIADSMDVDLIVVEGVEEKGIGAAIMHRLRKAAGERIIRV